MGWLNEDERREAKKKFHCVVLYLCNSCNRPIFDAPVVDKDGGYHPWPKTMPRNCRTFCNRNPKVTYHQSCMKSMAYYKIDDMMLRILRHIRKQPKSGYWTKEKIQSKLKYDSKSVVKALKQLKRDKLLKKKRGGYVPVRK